MRVRALLLAAAIFPTAFMSVAAVETTGCRTLNDAGTPANTSDDTLACKSVSYLSCANAIDAGITGKVQDPLQDIALTDVRPTTSFTAGGGCGTPEAASVTGTNMQNIYDLHASGFVEGNVDTLTVELHNIYAGAQRVTGTMNLDVRLDIAGTSPNGRVAGVPKAFRIAVDPAASATGASESFTFTITDLYKKFPELSGVGTGVNRHQALAITVSAFQTDYAGAWVWGATEIPASLTLNGPAAGYGKTVSALSLG